jgi:hypothetical protein
MIYAAILESGQTDNYTAAVYSVFGQIVDLNSSED